MQSMEDVVKKLKKWEVSYFVSLFILVGVYLVYIGYSLIYEPEKNTVLLNNFDAIYQDEDLSKTNISEGQLKQIVHDTLVLTFSFDYLSMVNDADYRKLINGELSSDIPDHRDVIRGYYSPDSFSSITNKIQNENWMDRFYVQKRRLEANITTPPVKRSQNEIWSTANDGRLNATYDGFLYVLSNNKGNKQLRFRVNYSVTMERKPNFSNPQEQSYFFGPLVKHNTNEWRVKSIEWESERI